MLRPMPRQTRFLLARSAAFMLIAAAAFLALVSPAQAQANAQGPSEGQLDQWADAQIAAVQAEPPIHERETPWAVSVRELELELQPLRISHVEERLEIWLGLLEDKARDRARISIALSRTDDAAQKAELTSLETEAQEIVLLIAERAKVLVDLYEQRGGDATEARQYVSDLMGLKKDFMDPEVLSGEVRNWLTSERGGIAWALNIIKFIAIVFVFVIISKIVATSVRIAVRKASPSSSQMLVNVLSRNTKRAVLLVGVVVAISQLGVNINPLIAAIGAAGLVIGLALQGTLSNFASGILILMNKPYDVGDVINAGGVLGKVEAMTLVSTKILTFDNQVMYVPNNNIWGGVITNITGLSTRRIDMTFGIGYDDDYDKAREVLTEIVTSHDKVLKDPEPVIQLHELADSSVNFIVRPWCNASDYWDVYWYITREVKARFDQEGISIPYPQQDVHMHQVLPAGE